MPASRVDAEHLIVGAGVSGLTLAYYLAHELGPDCPIVIVDRDDDPNYNISFWSDRPTPFEAVMQKSWHTVAVRHGDRQTVCPLSRYTLRAFWRDDFDEHLARELGTHPCVRLEDAAVTGFDESGDHVEVRTTKGTLRAAWVYDSRSSLLAIRQQDPDLMLMQGLAVEIECAADVFDPDVATLFDFLLDTPQLDFLYVLPHTKRYALVNLALLTPYETTVTRETCERTIDAYVRQRLGCDDYAITKACYGRLPLAANYPRRDPSRRIVPIGVRAGMIKASTSYAFTRILSDAQRTAAALRDTGRPFFPRRRPWYYRWADKSTARVFQHAPKLAQELMFMMFTPQNGDLALSFLDERNSLGENRGLFQAIPTPTVRRFLRELLLSTFRR